MVASLSFSPQRMAAFMSSVMRVLQGHDGSAGPCGAGARVTARVTSA